MAEIESPTDEDAFLEALARVQLLLEAPVPVRRTWPALAAAGFFALSAMIFATAAILAPPARIAPVADVRGPL
jgi:hypothetical protein